MRKLLLALLVGVFVFSYTLSASATELKTYGYFKAYVSHVTNYNFDDKTDGNEFTAAQRLRPYFDFVANENLKATLGLEFDTTWGKKKVTTHYKDAAGAAGMDVAGVTELKRACLTFKWPNTNMVFKIGAQGLDLPSTFGASPILNGDITGAIMSTPVNDMVSVTLGWARPWLNIDGNAAIGSGSGDAVDAFFLAVPVKLDGVNINPYFVYAFLGKNIVPDDGNMAEVYALSGGLNAAIHDKLNGDEFKLDKSTLWYAGMAYTISMFEPITVKGNIVYGSLDSDIKYMGNDDIGDRSGWYVDLAIDYKMDMMTPSIYGYYFSGDDDNPYDGSETIPVLANDGWGTPAGFTVGTISSFSFNDNIDALYQDTPAGVWLIGFALKDISLIDNLTSTFAIEYAKGTIDSKLVKNYGPDFVAQMDGSPLTDEDSAIQVMLRSKYKIYENLAAVLELGYASLDMDENTWGKDYMDDAAYEVNFGFTYNF